MDILQDEGCGGPADILLSQGILQLRDVKIPCKQVRRKETVRRVTAADHYTVPARSQAALDVYVDRRANVSGPSQFVISASPWFHEKYPLMIAETLVDVIG